MDSRLTHLRAVGEEGRIKVCRWHSVILNALGLVRSQEGFLVARTVGRSILARLLWVVALGIFGGLVNAISVPREQIWVIWGDVQQFVLFYPSPLPPNQSESRH